MNYFLNLITQHPKVFLIILIIALLLILFIYVLPFIFKLIGKRQNVKETSALKKDLMIWRKISNLAKGGSNADKSKLLLAKEQIEILRDSFNRGIAILRANGRKLYDVPWYICIGEPGAGKSAIMSNHELNLLASEEEDVDIKGKPVSASLRFWFGIKAVVLEVGGKTFFDRWFGGSSAEFNEIIKLLGSKHGKKPLSGIILTIPADALIGDDKELTQKKASLIATEFNKLLNKLSINLPCYVLISKLDVVTGFKDYFSRFDDNMRNKVFGWDNRPNGNDYDKEIFKDFWGNIVESLRKGRNTLLLPKPPIFIGNANEAGNIYMFPEAFDTLYANLDVYLKTIFSKQMQAENESLKLEGVYFTAGKDQGITLNPEFAKLKNMQIEDAPMYSQNQSSKSFFIADLLNNRIFNESPFAGLTHVAKMKRDLPIFVLSSFFMIVGIVWGGAAIFNSGKLRSVFNTESTYYEKMETLLTNKVLDYSPLVSTDESGKGVVLFNKPMFNNEGIERMAFFLKAYNQAMSVWGAPFGFKTSSLIKYGQTNLAYNERQFIFNKIQTRMSFFPILNAVEKNFQQTINQPVAQLKRDAIFELLKIAALQENDSETSGNYSQYRDNAMNAFISYMFPDFSPETRKILTTYNVKYDKYLTATNLEILLSPSYAKGYEAGIKSIINGWLSLTNYPEDPYSLQKNLINYGAEMESLFNKYKSFDPLPLIPGDIVPIEINVNEWLSLYEEEKRVVANITNAISRLWSYYKEKMGSEISNKMNLATLLPPAYISYQNQLNSDFDMLETYGRVNIKRSDGYSVYHSLIETNYLQKIKDNINRKLQNDYAVLKKRMVTIENNPFLKEAQNPDNDTLSVNNSNYAVIGNLLKFSVLNNMNIQEDIVNFGKSWRENESIISSQSEQLKAYINKYGNNYFVETLAPMSQKMFEMQASYRRIILGNYLLAFYPLSITEFMTKIYNLESPTDTMGTLLVKNSEPASGKITFRGEFNPDVINHYINPFGVLRNSIAAKEKSGIYDYAIEYFLADRNYQNVSFIMENYNKNFIQYWGNFADSFKPNFSTYSTFHSFINSALAYRINSMLYSVYDKSYEFLSNVNDAFLTPSTISSKNSYLLLIANRRNTLNSNYSEYCTKLLDSWASLPNSAQDANKVLISMSNRRLMSDFLISQASDSSFQDIPWWRNLFLKGINLIKTEVLDKARSIWKNYQRSFSKFPLVADGSIHDVLSPEDIKLLVNTFKDYGWFAEPANENEEGDNTILEIKEPVKLNKIIKNENEIKKWSETVMRILNAIGGSTPLEWTLIIPDSEEQASLASKYSSYPSAMARFRYINIAYLSSVNSKRVPTNAGAGKEINAATGEANARDLIFNFYAYSDSKLPEASLKMPGAWAPVRFYLKRGAIKNSDKGIYYIPLIIKDLVDMDYIFYVGIKFNKPLPEPNEWPTRSTKPELDY